MKSLTINESLSADSTLESPSKPHPEKPEIHRKNIFLVQSLGEVKPPEILPPPPTEQNIKKPTDNIKVQKKTSGGKKLIQKSISKTKIKKKEKISASMAMLDFDFLIKTIFNKPKKKVTRKVKSVKTKAIKSENKSKKIIKSNSIKNSSKSNFIGKKRKRPSLNISKSKNRPNKIVVKKSKYNFIIIIIVSHYFFL